MTTVYDAWKLTDDIRAQIDRVNGLTQALKQARSEAAPRGFLSCSVSGGKFHWLCPAGFVIAQIETHLKKAQQRLNNLVGDTKCQK